MIDALLLAVLLDGLRNAINPVDMELVWFAMRGFGGYNLPEATIFAILGALIGTVIIWCVGRLFGYAARNKTAGSARYQKIAIVIKRLPLLMVIAVAPVPQLLAVMFGFFRVPLWQVLLFAAIGRVVYYGMYL